MGTMNGNCDVCLLDTNNVPAVREGVKVKYPLRRGLQLFQEFTFDLCEQHLTMAESNSNEIQILGGA